MSTLTTTAIERYQPPILTEVEQTTLLGFLAGSRGFTRESYMLICASSLPDQPQAGRSDHA